jgi:hypothetical protein
LAQSIKEVEMPLEKFATDTALSVTRTAEKFIKDVWSKLDAVSDKPKPSEYLSSRGIKAIQGVHENMRSDR